MGPWRGWWRNQGAKAARAVTNETVFIGKGERCCRCGARAYVVTAHGDAGTLAWCAHHFARVEVDLWQAVLFDERWAIPSQVHRL